jgi:hypothetical protein
MAQVIARMAPAALGLSSAPVHEPVHANGGQRPVAITERGVQNPSQRCHNLTTLSDTPWGSVTETLAFARPRPAHADRTGRTPRSKWLTRDTGRCSEQPSPSLLIVQLAVTASMADPGPPHATGYAGPLTRRLLIRILAATREADENEAGLPEI